jgi:hypothetical protein
MYTAGMYARREDISQRSKEHIYIYIYIYIQWSKEQVHEANVVNVFVVQKKDIGTYLHTNVNMYDVAGTRGNTCISLKVLNVSQYSVCMHHECMVIHTNAYIHIICVYIYIYTHTSTQTHIHTCIYVSRI